MTTRFYAWRRGRDLPRAHRKSPRTIHLLGVWLLGAACGAKPPVNEPPSEPPSVGPFVQDYEARSLLAAAAEPGWLVRVREGQHHITHLAVQRDSLVFATTWEAVYLLDMLSGTVTALDVDSNALWGPIVNSTGDWQWVKRTSGPNEEPYVQFRRSAPLGSEISNVFSASWAVDDGVTGGDYQLALHADATGLYTYVLKAQEDRAGLNWIPNGGGSPIRVFEFSGDVRRSTWLVDESRVYVSECRYVNDPYTCTILAGPKTEPGPRQTIARLPPASGGYYPYTDDVPMAADATDLYFLSGGDILKLSNAGGQPTVLAAASDETNLNGFLMVDATTVYFVEQRNLGASYLESVPKQGGPVTALGSARGYDAAIRLMAQDDSYLYVLWDDQQVFVQPKIPASGAPR